MVKAGYYGKNKVQPYKSKQCGKRFSEPKPFVLMFGYRVKASSLLCIAS
jgi:hypothetical protein